MKIEQAKIDAFKRESGAIATIQELLRGRDADFDAAKTIRLVRHADNRKEKQIEGIKVKGTLYDIYRNDRNQFLSYQREQKKGTLDKVDYIVSFIGVSGTRARFVGVYKVGATIVDSPYEQGCVLYDLEFVEAFESLTHQVVIEWGGGTAKIWHGFHNIKAVTRIDEGFEDENGVPRFISYADTILSLRELKAIINSQYDNPWQTALRAVNCIYLITDKKTGKHYVGSTYGKNGIWGRWEAYVTTNGHGNNQELKKLLSKVPTHAETNFQWSILEVLPVNITQDQAVDRETLFKKKLMSRKPFGYNEN